MGEDKKKKRSFFKFIFDSKYVIFAFAFGLVLGLGIMSTKIPTQIAKLSDGSDSIAIWDNNGSISANELYDTLKTKTNILSLLDVIDSKLLENDYPYEEYKEQSVTQAQELLTFYKENYGLTEEEFLGYYGYSDLDSFVEFLTLDTRRFAYYKDKLMSGITESQMKKYYKKNVFGPIGSKFISVDIDNDSKDDEKLIKEIQAKVNKGASYDDIVKEYGENTLVKYDDLDYVTYDIGMDESYVKALRKLKDNSHTTKYVKTDIYGYTIIFRTNSQEKPAYEDIKDDIKEAIFETLDSASSNIFEKTMIKMRNSYGLKFTDTEFAKQYNEYVKEQK